MRGVPGSHAITHAHAHTHFVYNIYFATVCTIYFDRTISTRHTIRHPLVQTLLCAQRNTYTTNGFELVFACNMMKLARSLLFEGHRTILELLVHTHYVHTHTVCVSNMVLVNIYMVRFKSAVNGWGSVRISLAIACFIHFSSFIEFLQRFKSFWRAKMLII